MWSQSHRSRSDSLHSAGVDSGVARNTAAHRAPQPDQPPPTIPKIHTDGDLSKPPARPTSHFRRHGSFRRSVLTGKIVVRRITVCPVDSYWVVIGGVRSVAGAANAQSALAVAGMWRSTPIRINVRIATARGSARLVVKRPGLRRLGCQSRSAFLLHTPHTH